MGDTERQGVAPAPRRASRRRPAVLRLQQGALEALRVLGSGVLAHPDNERLRAALATGDVAVGDLHRGLLATVHQHLCHAVASARGLASAQLVPTGPRPSLGDGAPGWPVSVAAAEDGTRGRLWTAATTTALAGCRIDAARHDEAVAALLGGARSGGGDGGGDAAGDGGGEAVDLAAVGAAELGAVHEALLAAVPHVDLAGLRYEVVTEDGGERTGTGVFYTPPALVDTVLDAVLDPVLDEVAEEPDPAAGLLALTVLDPACGAGNFLVAAAERIARRLATVRAGGTPDVAGLVAARREVVTRCIHGADVDDLAAGLAAFVLWSLLQDADAPVAALDTRFVVGDSLLGARPDDLPDDASAGADGGARAAADAWSRARLARRPARRRRGRGRPPPLADPDRRVVHWHLDVPDRATPDGRGMFDVVVGNPPYVRGRDHLRADPAGRALLTERHDACTGSLWNLWVPFVLEAARLARRRSGLLVQSSVLGAQYAGPLHRTLLRNHGVAACLDFSAVPYLFPDAAVQVACLVVTPAATAATRFVRYGAGLDVTSDVTVSRERLGRLPDGYWTLPTSGLPGAVVELFVDPPARLADIATVGDGMEQDAAYDVRPLVHEARGDADELRLVTTGLIDPFVSAWGRKPVRYLRTAHDAPVLRASELRAAGHEEMAVQGEAEKIAVAGLSRRIEAVVDEGRSLVSKSAYVVRLTDPALCPYAVAAVLNAQVMTELYDGAFGALGFGAGAKNYRPVTLGALPVPDATLLARDAGDGAAAGELSRLGRAVHDAAAAGEDLGALLDEVEVAVRAALGLAPAD